MAPLPKLLYLFLMVGISAAADMGGGMGGGTDPNSGNAGTGPAPAPNGMPVLGPQCDADNFNICANTHPTSFTVMKMASDGMSCDSKCVKDQELEAAWAAGYTCGLCPTITFPSCPQGMPVCANTSPTSYTVSRTTAAGCQQECYKGADLTNALASGFTCGACPVGNAGGGSICPNMDAMVPCGANMDMAFWLSNASGSCQEACLPAASGQFTLCGRCPASNPICPNMGSMTPCVTSTGAAGAIMIPTSGTCTEQCVAAATPGWMCGQCPDSVQPATCPANSNMQSCGNAGGYYVFGSMDGGLTCIQECAVPGALADYFTRGWACGVCPPAAPVQDPVCDGQTPCSVGTPPGYTIRPVGATIDSCSTMCAAGTALSDRIASGGGYTCDPCPTANVNAVKTTFAPNPPPPPPTPAPTPQPTLRPVLAPVVSNVGGGVAPVTPNTGGAGCSKGKGKGGSNSCNSKSKGGSKSSNNRASINESLDANSAAAGRTRSSSYGGVCMSAIACAGMVLI